MSVPVGSSKQIAMFGFVDNASRKKFLEDPVASNHLCSHFGDACTVSDLYYMVEQVEATFAPDFPVFQTEKGAYLTFFEAIEYLTGN